MRALWSEQRKRLLWRKIWVALAESQAELGMIKPEQAADLRAHAGDVTEASIARALQIEAEIHHDLMAEVKAFAEQCNVGGGVIHLGATSMDIEDNADALRLREGLGLIETALATLVRELATQTADHAETVCMAFTHLQPAEPTTVGYRLAQHLQDALDDLANLRRVRANVRGKGFKGAVGTSASYGVLLEGNEPLRQGDSETERLLPTSPQSLYVSPSEFEQSILAKLNLPAFDLTTQTYPRKQDWHVVNALAGIAQSLYKFAFDLRVLQSPPIGEWAEPFAAKQVGSSAMPFKRNPIHAEAIDSLARHLAALPRVMWDNAAHSLLERTLDDSANRRVVLPEAFLCADEIISRATRIVRNLRINLPQIKRNMAVYGPFAATERVLMAAARAGADRQHMHEVIREHSLAAWAAINTGQPNPLLSLLLADTTVGRWLPPDQVRACMDASAYVGDAPVRARAMAERAKIAG
jgi:adenylosuccinate lyase